MGKGYNNYMCKKPFHPGSKANIKRTWMAEQRTENEKKKQDDLKVQYEKEQDLYNNRALVSTESKDKLELNFMYEAPPGAKRERQKEDDEPEYKFEWQRKYNAPREDFAKGNAEIRDQPFGIPVRNVRCIKCHKWGHINTDKECPLFSQASTSSMPTTSMDPLELMLQMREDGYNLKQSVLGHHLNPQAANQQLLESEEEDPEVEFLKSLSSKQKHKLLKKLNKMAKKEAKGGSSCNKKKKSKKHKSKRKSSESESDGEKESMKKKSKKASKKPDQRSLNVDTSESSDAGDDKEEKVSKRKSKDSVDQRHRNNSSSESSASDDKMKQKGDNKKSLAPSSKDEHTDTKSKEKKVRKHKPKKIVDQRHGSSSRSENSDSEDDKIKEKGDCKKFKDEYTDTKCKEKRGKEKKCAASKIVSSHHGMKKKGKKNSKDSSSESSNTEKIVGAEDRTETDIKQELKATSSKDESKRMDTHVKQDVKDILSKQKGKRKSVELSSDSESSGTGSSSEEYQPKRLKPEVKKDSNPVKLEPSDSQGQQDNDDGTKASCSKAGVYEACINEGSNSPEHPDRFTCSTPPPPETDISKTSNLATFLLERKYQGDKDEKFRKMNRDRRSPSFKQKYRLT